MKKKFNSFLTLLRLRIILNKKCTYKSEMTTQKKEKGIVEKLLDFGAQKLEDTVEQYVEEKITNKLVKIGEVSVAFLLGIILVIVGVAQFAASQIAFLENGLNYVLIGSVLLLVAYFLSR